MDLKEAAAACGSSQLQQRMYGWLDGDQADLEAYIGERERAGDGAGAARARGWLGKKKRKVKTVQGEVEGADNG